jgi:hypothetical protein
MYRETQHEVAIVLISRNLLLLRKTWSALKLIFVASFGKPELPLLFTFLQRERILSSTVFHFLHSVFTAIRL